MTGTAELIHSAASRARVLVISFVVLGLAGCSLLIDGDPPSFADAGFGDAAGSTEMDAGATPCSTLVAPLNGSLDRTTGAPGEAVTYSCEDGYLLVGNGGSTSRVCRADGTWTGEDPRCEREIDPCEPNPCANGGICDIVGEVYSCACLPESGYAGPMCSMRVTCEEVLASPDDGAVHPIVGEFGDVATYWCDSGYRLVGEATRTCQADRSWSGTPPICESTGGYFLWPIPGSPGHSFDYQVGVDTVRDRVTGLEWERTPASGRVVWDAAQRYCADLILSGNADWRVPTRMELISIIDYSRRLPAIDPIAFVATSDAYWTASAYAADPGRAWAVGFGDGWVLNDPRSFDYPVRCVREGAP